MMSPDWIQIDWPRTLCLAAVFALVSLLGATAITGRWGGVVINLKNGKSRPALRPTLDTATFWPAWAVCLAGLAGGAMVLGAVYHKGRYASETAGWAQAAGALLSILVVILSNQLTNNRLVRQQRNAELKAFGDRIRAIHNLRDAYAQAQGHLNAMTLVQHKVIKVSQVDIDHLRRRGRHKRPSAASDGNRRRRPAGSDSG